MPRILYVEDNEDNVYMLRRRLAKHGYEMIVAADGAKGDPHHCTVRPRA